MVKPSVPSNQSDTKFKVPGHPPFHFIKLSKNTGRVKVSDFLQMLSYLTLDPYHHKTYAGYLADKIEINLHEFLFFLHDIKVVITHSY